MQTWNRWIGSQTSRRRTRHGSRHVLTMAAPMHCARRGCISWSAIDHPCSLMPRRRASTHLALDAARRGRAYDCFHRHFFDSVSYATLASEHGVDETTIASEIRLATRRVRAEAEAILREVPFFVDRFSLAVIVKFHKKLAGRVAEVSPHSGQVVCLGVRQCLHRTQARVGVRVGA